MLLRAAAILALLFASRVVLADEGEDEPSPVPSSTASPAPIPTPSPVHARWTCCSPLCSPSWSADPERTKAWLEMNGGLGGTNRAQGAIFGMALGYAVAPGSIIRLSWVEYQDNTAGGRHPRDRFDTFAAQYGIQKQTSPGVVFSATAGLGYSRGLARGRLLFAESGARWYRPIQYDAISVTGNLFAGVAGKIGAVGIAAVGDANPERQSWGAQLTLIYGPILDLPKRRGSP